MNPFSMIKAHPMGAILLVLIGYVVLTLVDDKFAGGKLNSTVRGFVG